MDIQMEQNLLCHLYNRNEEVKKLTSQVEELQGKLASAASKNEMVQSAHDLLMDRSEDMYKEVRTLEVEKANLMEALEGLTEKCSGLQGTIDLSIAPAQVAATLPLPVPVGLDPEVNPECVNGNPYGVCNPSCVHDCTH